MQVLIIAGLGIAIVLISILWLKLHPFLGLILGALFVLWATPRSVHLENELAKSAALIRDFDPSAQSVELSQPIKPGKFRRWALGNPAMDADSIELRTIDNQAVASRHFLIVSELPVAWSLEDRIIEERLVIQAEQTHLSGIAKRLADGLSSTFSKIGLPIAMAAIIGMCLLESGAASRIVMAMVGLFGEKRTAPALSASGFLLGVPVYFDTVFYLLLPLAKAFGKRSSGSYLLAVMAIIVGATMAHSLVPPTPGPLLVASELGVSIGAMMIGGTIVGGSAAALGYAYGIWISQRMTLAVPDSTSSEANESTSLRAAKIPLLFASLPLAIPLVCLGGAEIWKAMVNVENTPRSMYQSLMALLSDPGFVLILAAVVAIGLLRYVVAARDTIPMMNRAIADAGTILMLTCAGGAFGAALKQLRLADAVTELFPNVMTPYGILVTAFLLTGIIRVAQGSATVAMITTVGIVAPLVKSQELPFHPVYVALAIGCGSKLLPWMNDSGFWQVATMSGMSTTQTLRVFSVALTIMGFVGFALTVIGSLLFPLAGT